MVETTAYQPDPATGTGRTFDAGMMTAGLSYARSFTDKFSAGVTANFVHEGLAEFTQQTLRLRRRNALRRRCRWA